MNRDAEDLAKLSSLGRVKLLLTGSRGRWFLLMIAGALASLIFSFLSLDAQHNARRSEELAHSLQQLTEHTLQPVADSVLEMSSAAEELKRQVAALPASQQKADIQKLVDVLSRRIIFLQAYTRNLSERDKRSDWSIFSRAYADTPASTHFTVEDARPWAFLVILIALAVTFIGSIGLIFFAKDAEVLKFAFDTVKTLLGFFIGVATTFMGVSVH
jgi:hypothetical protein